eukprot:TRINITY_DN16908_c0_g2_i2.p1 TRINITY_DN16908_c0_g2~~TRINITY_DN16908_c0_g2_i2.p1  ORF type:complete len:235 (-),score=32.13 TRINITY_DN16908_c0_g2_i2:231-935(-)
MDMEGSGHRSSMLEVTMERLQKRSKLGECKLFYCGRISTGVKNRNDVITLHEDVLASASPDGEHSGVLLLTHSGCIIHFLESTSETALAVLRALKAKVSEQETAMLEDIKVLTFAEDAGPPQYPEWTANSINVVGADVPDEAHVVPTVSAIYNNLRKLGDHISSLSKFERQKVLGDLKNGKDSGDLLPQNEQVIAMVDSAEVCPLDTFLEVYDTPVNIELESDRIWPIPPRLEY